MARWTSALIGTWKLVSVKARDLDGGEERDAWGPNPVGYINYGPDGRMIVINARSGRAKPQERSADAAGGRRPVPGHARLCRPLHRQRQRGHAPRRHFLERGAGPARNMVRIARFDGDRVHLSTRPTPDPVNGRMSVRTMTWEKLK